MNASRTQIIATIGPSTRTAELIQGLADANLDVARINMSWGSQEEDVGFIRDVRAAARAVGRTIPVIIDLTGPRAQEKDGHHFSGGTEIITEKDKDDVRWGVGQGVEYFALSYVGGPDDIEEFRRVLSDAGSSAKIIAKIERKEAVACAADIISASDAIMVARGDLGNEVPLEQIPFIQYELVQAARKAAKPVIVATEMLSSMIEHPVPTRAEITDIAFATLMGADAVMLSNETAVGKYPLEAIAIMERTLLEAERRGIRMPRLAL